MARRRGLERDQRQTANAADVTFPVGHRDMGTISHFGLFDAVTGGNLLVWGGAHPEPAS